MLRLGSLCSAVSCKMQLFPVGGLTSIGGGYYHPNCLGVKVISDSNRCLAPFRGGNR